MVTHYISNIIPEQAGHAGWEGISWKIQNRRLFSWICPLHHTKRRFVPNSDQHRQWLLPTLARLDPEFVFPRSDSRTWWRSASDESQVLHPRWVSCKCATLCTSRSCRCCLWTGAQNSQSGLTPVPLVPLSGSALRAAMADTTATHTSPALWTQRTSDGCSTTAETSSRECTCGSTSSCDGRHQRSSALFCLHRSTSLRNFSSSSSPCSSSSPLGSPWPPLLSKTMKYCWSVNSSSFLALFTFNFFSSHFIVNKGKLGNKVSRLFEVILHLIPPF